MRALLLSEDNHRKARRVADYAEQPEHYYRPPADWVPGDQPEYTCLIDTYRCVFTITVAPDGRRYRHLSMSVPRPTRLPNPLSAFTIATWFGFTGAPMQEDVALGPGPDWITGLHEAEFCIVLAQNLPQVDNVPK